MDYYASLFASKVSGGGGSAVLINKDISANGTYNASSDNADGYKKVVVDVPNPSAGSINITQNGTYDVTEKASAVVNVPTPIVEPLSVTENGTYQEEGKAYSPVNVNVSGGGSDELVSVLDGTIQSLSNNDITSLRTYALNSCSNLTYLSLPNCTVVGNSSVADCPNLAAINLPKLAAITGTYVFSSDKKLVSVELPSLRGALGNWTFNDCSLLETVDLGAGVNNLSSQSFLKCKKLNKLILRSSSVVATNTNVFNNTPFASGGSGGEIYVPSALLSSYPTATNWSTLNGYGTITWKAIEGSIYE